MILLVEDYQSVARPLIKGLQEEGYVIRHAKTLAESRSMLKEQTPELVLLDLGLPDGEGLDLIPDIRQRCPEARVIVLTARHELDERVEGLEAGADDYVAKPFQYAELLARIRAQLRSKQGAGLELNLAGLRIDLVKRGVFFNQTSFDLTPKEFDLLAFFARNQGTAIGREELIRSVWPEVSEKTNMNNTLDVHISKLRDKVFKPCDLPVLKTLRGFGFTIQVD